MLTPLDIIVIVLYLVVVVTFGIRAAGSQQTTRDYFLGGRNLPWWAICFSIVATETSTLTVIGIPAVAFGGAMTFFQITFGYLAGRILVGWLLLPRYAEGELQSAYQFIGSRFGTRLQGLSSATFLVTRLLADGVRLFATAIPIRVVALAAGFDLGYPAIIIGIGIVTAAYTYAGGLKSVVWMDVLQMTLYLVGGGFAIVVLLTGMPEGAFDTLKEAGKLQVFNGTWSVVDILTQPYALFTAVVGGAIFSMASHGTDQLIVQRLLACRNLADSRKALVGSALFVMAQFALFLVLGSLLWVHYGGLSAADLGLTRADEVYPKFILEGLPAGVSGLVLAGILAAAMSTLSSSLNALASSSMTDILGRRLASRSDQDRLKFSRAMTLGWTVVFIVFAIQFTNQQNPVVELGLSIASFTYGALLGAFLLGLWFTRVRESDAIIAFMVSVVSMVLIIFGLWHTADAGWVFVFRPGPDEQAARNMVSLAWPWYTGVGTAITLAIGSLLSFRHS